MKRKTLSNLILVLGLILASAVSLVTPQAAVADGYELFIDSGQNLGSSSSQGVALGAVDGDGDLDAFVTNAEWPAGGPNKLWLNDGAGTFVDSGQSLGGFGSRDVALGDLDGDGDLDAFVANRGSNFGLPNKVWLNDGLGNFTDSGQSLGNSSSRSLSLGDLDGDGDLDAFIANSPVVGGGPNRVWLNDGGAQGGTPGNFTDSGYGLGNSNSHGVALGDVDGDGDFDAFVTNYVQADRVWLNDGTGSFVDSCQSLDVSSGFDVALGDLNGDGALDAFVANWGQSNTVWLNDGVGTFVDSGQLLGNSESLGVALGDLNGDGTLDAFVANYGEPNKVWLNDGTGSFSDSGQNLGGSNSWDVALGDVEGDGDLDAFIANGDGQANKVWLNTSINALVVTIDINPNTLNLKSKGKWVTAYIELPDGYDVVDIDVGTVTLEDTIPTEDHPTKIGDYDNDGVADLMVKFERQALIEYLEGTTGGVRLTVNGEFSDGTPFEGSDTITVINPGKKKK